MSNEILTIPSQETFVSKMNQLIDAVNPDYRVDNNIEDDDINTLNMITDEVISDKINQLSNAFNTFKKESGLVENLNLNLVSKDYSPFFGSTPKKFSYKLNPREYYLPLRVGGTNITASTVNSASSSYYGAVNGSNKSKIIYAKNKYWYVSYNRIYSSTDLKKWNSSLLPYTIYGINENGFSYINNRFYLCYDYGNTKVTDTQYKYSGGQLCLYTSTDGINWTKCSCPMNLNFTTVYMNSKYYAIAHANEIIYSSSDGINFITDSNVSMPTTGPSTLYAGNNSLSMTSPYDLNINSIIGIMNNYLYIICNEKSGDRYYQIIYKSNNLSSWTQVSGKNSSTDIGGVSYSSGYSSYPAVKYFKIFNNQLFMFTYSGYSYQYNSNEDYSKLQVSKISESGVVTSSTLQSIGTTPNTSYIWISEYGDSSIAIITYSGNSSNNLRKYLNIINVDTLSWEHTSSLLSILPTSTSAPYTDYPIGITKYNDGCIIFTDLNEKYSHNITSGFNRFEDNNTYFNNLVVNNISSINYKNHQIDITVGVNDYNSSSDAYQYYYSYKLTFDDNNIADFWLPIDYLDGTNSSKSTFMSRNPLYITITDNNDLVIIFNQSKSTDDSNSPRYSGCYAYICNFDIVDNKVQMKYWNLKPILFNTIYTENDINSYDGSYVNSIFESGSSLLMTTSGGILYTLNKSSFNILNTSLMPSIKGISKIFSWHNTLVIHCEDGFLLQSSDGLKWNPIKEVANHLDVNVFDVTYDNDYIYILDSWNTLYKFEDINWNQEESEEEE